MAAGKNLAFMVLPAMRSIVRTRAFRAPHHEGLVTQFLKRDEFRMNDHRALVCCLSMISARNASRVCREGNPLHTLR